MTIFPRGTLVRPNPKTAFDEKAPCFLLSHNWRGKVLLDTGGPELLVQNNWALCEKFWIKREFVLEDDSKKSSEINNLYVLKRGDQMIGGFHTFEEASYFAATDYYNNNVSFYSFSDLAQNFYDAMIGSFPVDKPYIAEYLGYYIYFIPLIKYPELPIKLKVIAEE